MLKNIIKISNKIKGKLLKKKYKVSGFALEFIKDSMKKELNKSYPINEVKKAHKNGFLYENWKFSKIDDSNFKEYLSDLQYLRMHPINKKYSHWIDDKLTLKYMLAGNKNLRQVMPNYYWHIDEEGKLLPLLDLSESLKENNNYINVLELLKVKKNLALKLFSGSLGEGFYKFSYVDSNYYINEKLFSEKEVLNFLKNLKGYLIVEFLKPNEFLAKFCKKTTNTIRYLSGRLDNKIVLLKGFIRFGTKKSNFVDNYNAGGVLCYFNEDGYFKNGHILNIDFSDSNILVHPDTKEVLKGTLPDFEKMKMIVEEIHNYLPQLKYCGIDFVYTDKNEYKILEINSLTSLDALQLEESILKSKYGKFYLERLK